MQGAHLPFQSREPIAHTVIVCECDAWPMQRQTYGYLRNLMQVPS